MQYKRITVNGMDFDVPTSDGAVSEPDIAGAADLPPGDVIVQIDKEQSINRPIPQGEKVDLAQGTEFVSTSPWQAAGRVLPAWPGQEEQPGESFSARPRIGW